MNPVLLLLLLGAVAGAATLLWIGLRVYRKYRGERLVICPETKKPAAVEVAAARRAMEVFVDHGHIRLKDCSRWPERRNCGQECLSQVEAAPADCLVWNIVNQWYEGKECVYCHRQFGHLEWHDHPPALMDAQRCTVTWSSIPAEKLPEVFATHWPVCWDCHVAETFRREHADLVVDRPTRV